jgi:hypothetical protein
MINFFGDRNVLAREIKKQLALYDASIRGGQFFNGRTTQLGKWCWTDSVLKMAGLPVLANAKSVPTQEQNDALVAWCKGWQ